MKNHQTSTTSLYCPLLDPVFGLLQEPSFLLTFVYLPSASPPPSGGGPGYFQVGSSSISPPFWSGASSTWQLCSQSSKQIHDLFIFLVFLCFFMAFGGLNYPKMANLGFRIDSHSFWNIFGTSKKSINLDPRTPYSSQNYYKKCKNNPK